jgi:hypothetical protein
MTAAFNEKGQAQSLAFVGLGVAGRAAPDA